MNACDRTSTLARFLAAAVFCAMMAFIGCDRERVWVEESLLPPGFRPRTSPQNLLHNLKQAYQHRNITEYDSLLAEDFTFVLSEEDQQEPELPDSWRYDSEIRIHTRMFDAEFVQVLTLAYETGDPTWDAEEGKYAVVIQRVNLYLYGSTPGHPTEVKEYRISDRLSRLWFRKNPWTTGAAHDSVWTIVRWEDEPADSHASLGPPERVTWGSIKATFR